MCTSCRWYSYLWKVVVENKQFYELMCTSCRWDWYLWKVVVENKQFYELMCTSCRWDWYLWKVVRQSRPGVLHKNGVLKNFAKLTGKHLYQSFFFNKVAGLRQATLSKRDSNIDVLDWSLAIKLGNTSVIIAQMIQ